MQALQVLVILITSTLAIAIVTIDQFGTPVVDGNASVISNESISLTIKLSGCQSQCSCQVQTNETGDWKPMSFPRNSSNGGLIITNLKPYTIYSFVVNCTGANELKNHSIRTDVSYPSAPRNVTLTLNGPRLQLTWFHPDTPQGPISDYRVTVDKQEVRPTLSNSTFSYQLNEDYVYGTKRTLAVKACNIDNQDRPYCSNFNDAEVSYQTGSGETTTGKPPLQLASTIERSEILLLLILIVNFDLYM